MKKLLLVCLLGSLSGCVAYEGRYDYDNGRDGHLHNERDARWHNNGYWDNDHHDHDRDHDGDRH